jgi:tetratricopeptide (TPR) repeat protein
VLHNNIGNLRSEILGGGGFESYERANEISESLVREYPSMVDFRMQYARSLGNFALGNWGPQTKTRAIPAYIRVAELQREGLELHPNSVKFRFDLGLTLYHLARAHLMVDEPQVALRHTQEAIERLEAGLASDKDPSGQSRSLLGMICQKRAEALVVLGREDEAVEVLRAAIDHQREALERDPRSDDYREQLLDHHYQLASVLSILGRTHEVAANLEAMQSLWPSDPRKLFSNAGKLARGWSKAMGANGGRAERTGKATQLYGGLVMTLLEHSVNAGFRDFSRLISAPDFDAFRARDDFQRLLLRMMDLAFPANPLSH